MITAALVLVIAAAMPSYASGSFTWTVNFKCCLDSRNWTQGSGSTVIVSRVICEDGMAGKYYITLYKNQTGADKSYGRVTYACGKTLQYTWTGLPSGTYHFRMEKVDDGVWVTGNGSVSYP